MRNRFRRNRLAILAILVVIASISLHQVKAAKEWYSSSLNDWDGSKSRMAIATSIPAFSLASSPLLSQSVNSASHPGEPPVNSFIADSPWAIYHRNSYAQASTPLRGLEPGDTIQVDFLRTRIGGTSPWSQISEQYPDGERVMWGATATHVFKASLSSNEFELIDSKRIDYNFLSLHWNLLLLANNKVIVPDPARRKIYRFADGDRTDPRSPIVLEATFEIPDRIPGKSAHINVTYDGWIVFTTDAGYIATVKSDFSDYRYLHLPQSEGAVNYHNAFSLDEEGGIYLVTTDRMIRVNWDGDSLSLGWSVPYNFRGAGCEGQQRNVVREVIAVARGEDCTGSGTTPTLMGFGDMDKLVLVADGHRSNNMIAVWRDEIPTDWAGLPGHDRRIAAVTPLPYSTPEGEGFTAENSPTAWGYDIAIAQYNGFQPPCNPLNGVQKLRWNPADRTLQVVWATDAVNFNNVLTYSNGSNLVYGSGRRNCVYYFWGLDWQTGKIQLEVPLGDSSNFLDQGNQVSISDDRRMVFGSSRGIVRLRPTR
jgi:hypothetical protein